MKEATSFFDCTQPKFLITNKIKKDKKKNKIIYTNNLIYDKFGKFHESSKRKIDNSNIVFPEIPLNPEKNKFILLNMDNSTMKSRNYKSIDTEYQHSKIFRPGYSRIIILDKLKNDNEINSYSSRKSLYNKYPKEITVKNLPLFENQSNNNMISINFPSLDNPSKRHTKRFHPVSNSKERDIKSIILHSIYKEKKRYVHKNEKINPELGSICYSTENIRVGSKYCKYPKADDAEDWSIYNNKIHDMYEKDKFRKIRTKKLIEMSCYEYLEYARKKKHDECSEKIHETVKEIIKMKQKFNKLFTDVRKEKFDVWKNDDDD